MPIKKPRINKTKEQLATEIKHLEKVNRDKMLVKMIFPLLSGQKNIYDAQTVLAALSGFIKSELDKKSAEFVVKDLKIDLSKEEDSEIKSAIISLMGLLEIEKAKDTAALLERFGNVLAQYSANEFMKGPISGVSVDSLVA